MSLPLICMPAHLPRDVAKHIAEQASERGWSNSQYLRHLAKLDKKRFDDDSYISESIGIYAPEQTEQSERTSKSPTAGTVGLNSHITSE